MAGVFLRVLNMSIAAGWIVLAVLVLRLLLKKAPKWITVLLWGIVAVRLICPLSIESAMSLVPSRETVSYTPASPRPVISTGITAVDTPVNEYLGGNYYEGVTRPTGHFADVTSALAMVWLAGMAVLLAYTVISWVRLKNKTGTAVLLRDNIRQSENVASPFVLGVIKPKIYLPFGMNEQEAAHVIAHENAHIRRKDHWWKPLGFLILTLHWFNPLVWLAYLLLCRDIELACDEKVIAHLSPTEKADYSQAILSCSISRRSIAACPLAFGEVGVKTRIKQVLNYRKPAFWLAAVAVVASIVAAVCFLTDPESKNLPFDAPVMIVVSNEQSIEVKAGEKSWSERLPNGWKDGLQYSPNHPLSVITNLPQIDIVPTYFSYLDPLSALISFNVESGDPTRTTTPDEMEVLCWPESQWYKQDPQYQTLPVKVVNGNLYIDSLEGNGIYEVVATWNGDDSYSGTVRYAFCVRNTNLSFDFSAAAVIEITALGKGGFCQITDDDVIAKIVDKINCSKFYPGKIGEFEDNAYEMKFYDRHAQLIDKIIMMSDREILYGEDTVNYIAAPKYSLGYDYIDSLYRQANPQ